MVSRRVLAACAGLLALASLAHPAAAADVVDAPFVWVVAPRPVVREVVVRPRVTLVRPAAVVRRAVYGCGCLDLPWGGIRETYVDLPWGGLRPACAPVVRRVIRTHRVVLSRKG
jgi:hypothetical protein